MSVTAETPMTNAEFQERLVLAKRYGGLAAVHNLCAELRRRNTRVEVPAEISCGLEAATAGVESADVDEGRLSKRHPKQKEIDKLKRRMAAHDGPPTKEEIAEHLTLTTEPDVLVDVLNRSNLAKIDGFGHPLKPTPFESWISSSAAPTQNSDAALSDSIGF